MAPSSEPNPSSRVAGLSHSNEPSTERTLHSHGTSGVSQDSHPHETFGALGASRRHEALGVSQPPRTEATAYIALGSNMGDREAHLMRAIAELDQQAGIRVTGVSGIYETDPVGYTDQSAFLNMAVAVKTELEPLELLRTQLRLESSLGRIRQVRWGPRTIDLDLLLYDNVRMDQEELTLPHPRMMERAFVLVPLHDVISSSHPLHEQVATTSARALQAGKDGITLWKTINWRSASEPSGS